MQVYRAELNTPNRPMKNLLGVLFFTVEQLFAVALSDKKRAGGMITLVVPYGVADSRLVTVPLDALEGYIRAGLDGE